jgi:hypothetical protein
MKFEEIKEEVAVQKFEPIEEPVQKFEMIKEEAPVM